MPVSYAFSRERKSRTSVLYGTVDPLPGQAKSCSAFPITRSTVRAFLRCDIRAPLHDRKLRLDLETSLLSFLRRMPNQVAWKHRLRMNQRLFLVFRSSASVVSAGGSAAGSSALAATVVAGSSVLAVLLIRIHFVKVLRVLCRGSEIRAPQSYGTLPSRKGLTSGLLMYLWFELPRASGPKSARVYCGYRPGPPV